MMANNRMFLVNKKTDKRVLLCKNLGGSWYTSVRDLNKDMEEFLNDAGVQMLMGPDGWSLEFEDPDQFDCIICEPDDKCEKCDEII